MEIRRASIWKALALAKVEALKEPKQHLEYTVDPVKV
jgi:hypothetical protein